MNNKLYLEKTEVNATETQSPWGHFSDYLSKSDLSSEILLSRNDEAYLHGEVSK